MASVAVTGASGFIGRRLIERLCRDGKTVRALVRNRPVDVDVDQDRLVTIKGALGDDRSIGELIDGVDAIVHLAGSIKAKSRDAFFDANEAGTHHLSKIAAARPKPPKLVLISSLAAREPSLSSYAASKRAGEEALQAAADGMAWTILRPPAVYGPGDRETLAFFKAIQRGIGAMLGSRQARFSLIHVDDLIAAITRVLEPGTADKATLELDDGCPGGYSWASMIAAAERASGKTALKVQVPASLLFALGHANAALRFLPGYVPMLTAEKARELTHLNWVANNHEILSKTGWAPAMSIDRGFPATIDWYRLHSWL
jgi:nucleoside-diphosphate-sugar epimerase